jgi:S-formylglutathione hydrolase FrmB
MITKVYKFVIESNYLKGNPLNDPFKRKVYILEVGEITQNIPIVIYLSGFLSSSISMLNYDPLNENFAEKLNRLHKEGKVKKLIMVLPDMFTKVGGNQYIDSTAVGMYEQFLVKELIPYLVEKYDSKNIILMGKSSGGYGSIVLGMKYPEIVKGVVDHSGDAYFEYVYLPLFPNVIRVLRRFKDAKEWLKRYWERDNKKEKEDVITLTIIAMSAFYSPNGEDFDLPFDLETGEILEDVWKRWLEKDPVRMVEKYHDNLKKLKLLYMDAGVKDEFKINFGTKILHKRLIKYGIPHVFEEFEGGHFNINFRYDISLSIISKIFSDGES